jgi:hypothetical protein
MIKKTILSVLALVCFISVASAQGDFSAEGDAQSSPQSAGTMISRAGSLYVMTSDSRARVYVDGALMGLSGRAIRGIAPGIHNILVKGDSSRFETKANIVFDANNSFVMRVRLVPQGSISIDAPEDTEVSILHRNDNSETPILARGGDTIEGLPLGEYRLVASMPGFEAEEAILRVEQGRFTSYTPFASLAMKSQPESEVSIELASEPLSAPKPDTYHSMKASSVARMLDVQCASYSISSRKVSQGEFEALMGYNPSAIIDEKSPVDNVSWFDALIYCNALSIKENLVPVYAINDVVHQGKSVINAKVSADWGASGYRLANEEEWECAAFRIALGEGEEWLWDSVELEGGAMKVTRDLQSQSLGDASINTSRSARAASEQAQGLGFRVARKSLAGTALASEKKLVEPSDKNAFVKWSAGAGASILTPPLEVLLAPLYNISAFMEIISIYYNDSCFAYGVSFGLGYTFEFPRSSYNPLINYPYRGDLHVWPYLSILAGWDFSFNNQLDSLLVGVGLEGLLGTYAYLIAYESTYFGIALSFHLDARILALAGASLRATLRLW